RTSTSGRARSGSPACASSRTTGRVTGKCAAITTTPIRGKKSAMHDREVATKVRDFSIWPVVKKRWRAWLRAVHRDIGYLAIGFTVIYAVSGIAQNHIEDWGEVSYATYEKTITIAP